MVRPDWLVPVDQPPIHMGFLVLRNNAISYFGQNLPTDLEDSRQIRLANYAILPGLVNSHSHLEFSDLEKPIPPGESFADWIQFVIRHRAGAMSDPSERLALKREAFSKGIRESFECGVRWIVDMTTEPWHPEWIVSSVETIAKASRSSVANAWAPSVPIAVQPCVEVVDVSELRREQSRSFAEVQFAANEQSEDILRSVGRLGLAPHSPYTASIELTRWSQQVSTKQRRLLAMHLAESSDEMQWLTSQDGPFESLMRPFLNPFYWSGLGNISERVDCLSHSWRSLIVHGNYLTDSELATMGLAFKTMAIVHCPRTHAHFGHKYANGNFYPMRDRIRMGVRHFLGTDSRASNPNLNLWQEAQSLRTMHSDVLSVDILKMITTDAAQFLQLSGGVGRIQMGSGSGLTAVKLNGNEGLSIYDRLLAQETTAHPLENVLLSNALASAASEIKKLR